MTLKILLLRVLCACCFVLIILVVFIPACIAPDANPDNNQKTRYWAMGAMRNTFQYALYETGHSNMLEYVASIEGAQNIPHVVRCETIRKIVNDSGIATERLKFDHGESFYENGTFSDAWGQPIVVTITTNFNGNMGLTMHSYGKNKRNENGKGDDILVWNDISMRPTTQ